MNYSNNLEKSKWLLTWVAYSALIVYTQHLFSCLSRMMSDNIQSDAGDSSIGPSKETKREDPEGISTSDASTAVLQSALFFSRQTHQ